MEPADEVVDRVGEVGRRALDGQAGDDLLDGQGPHRDAGTPSSATQDASCRDEAAYTMRPSPTQPWAAAHIAQCSPEVKTVAAIRSSGARCVAAQRASSNSG